MPRTKRTTGGTAAHGGENAALRLLLVDDEPAVRELVAEGLRALAAGNRSRGPRPARGSSPAVTLLEAANLAEARRQLAKGPVELLLVKAELADGSGLKLAGELVDENSATQTLVITDRSSVETAVEAIRAGAADLLVTPLKLPELSERLGRAIERHRAGLRPQQRIARLRRICKKLSEARDEVGKQVDVLCNDLVTAYQELASQMHQVAQCGEFAGLIRDELDLEQLLRKTLEYLLQKAGPLNAAIFLPSNSNEYSLGGYVNYDCTSESADILLQHLADVVAPRLADREGPLHITDNQTLSAWIGDDAAYLADSHVLAFACRHQGESLAAVTLFRDGSQPFDSDLVETCAAIAPLLAEHLVRLIRVHHRSAQLGLNDDSAA